MLGLGAHQRRCFGLSFMDWCWHMRFFIICSPLVWQERWSELVLMLPYPLNALNFCFCMLQSLAPLRWHAIPLSSSCCSCCWDWLMVVASRICDQLWHKYLAILLYLCILAWSLVLQSALLDLSNWWCREDWCCPHGSRLKVKRYVLVMGWVQKQYYVW